jgi:hypothetical protein
VPATDGEFLATVRHYRRHRHRAIWTDPVTRVYRQPDQPVDTAWEALRGDADRRRPRQVVFTF